MEKETGAKIIIRGKGSVKEGKVGRKDGQPLPGEDEPLHAFITASNPECVKKAVEKINDVIRQGIEVPEGHNDLRRMQLRELAQLNGTLRETDGPRCSNCGSTEHKSWLCPDKPNVTNNIMCSSCGGAGHIAKDCKGKRPGQGGPPSANSQAKIDEEYMSLMAELGEGPPPKTKEIDPLVQAQLNRGSYSIFDRNQTPRAITNTQTSQAVPPPPALPPGPPPNIPSVMNAATWNSSVQQPPPPPPPQQQQQQQYMGIPPLMHPPPPMHAPPPPMPWMQNNSSNNQPLPPGSTDNLPLPPGTGPAPMPIMPPPPPPGTGNSLPVMLKKKTLNKFRFRYIDLFQFNFLAMGYASTSCIIITISMGKRTSKLCATSSTTKYIRYSKQSIRLASPTEIRENKMSISV